MTSCTAVKTPAPFWPRADRTSETGPEPLPVYTVAELVGDGREAVLIHDGQAYRLRITSNRKLILTK